MVSGPASRIAVPKLAATRDPVAGGELRADIDAALVTELVAGAVLAHHAILGQPRSQAWADSLVDAVWELMRAR